MSPIDQEFISRIQEYKVKNIGFINSDEYEERKLEAMHHLLDVCLNDEHPYRSDYYITEFILSKSKLTNCYKKCNYCRQFNLRGHVFISDGFIDELINSNLFELKSSDNKHVSSLIFENNDKVYLFLVEFISDLNKVFECSLIEFERDYYDEYRKSIDSKDIEEDTVDDIAENEELVNGAKAFIKAMKERKEYDMQLVSYFNAICTIHNLHSSRLELKKQVILQLALEDNIDVDAVIAVSTQIKI